MRTHTKFIGIIRFDSNTTSTSSTFDTTYQTPVTKKACVCVVRIFFCVSHLVCSCTTVQFASCVDSFCDDAKSIHAEWFPRQPHVRGGARDAGTTQFCTELSVFRIRHPQQCKLARRASVFCFDSWGIHRGEHRYIHHYGD